MAKLKCSILLYLCAVCTLASASIEDELNFLNKNTRAAIHGPRRVRSNYADQLIDFTDYKNIADLFENTVDSCSDAYSLVCYNNNVTVAATIKLSTIRKSVLDILKTPVNENDLASVKIEKTLFHNCMNLGREDHYTKQQNLADFEYVMHSIYNHITLHSSWQSLDDFINALGFGHAFYEIKVERHPENFRYNIITLQPPSYVHIKRMSELVKKILSSSNDHLNDEGWNVWKFFESMKRNKREIGLFFDTLLQTTFFSLGKDTQVHNKLVELAMLDSWRETENLHLSNVAQIHWTNVISQEFKKVDVEVNVIAEELLIKSKPYFLNLYELLNSTSNDVISAVILTKLLAEQLPYVDWKSFNGLEPVIKEKFCFEETKLYGSSFVLLQRFKQENINGISSKTTLNMLNNIVSTINEYINQSYTLSVKQKRYLKSELESITVNILQPQDDQAVAGYYGDYHPTRIYFTDILIYRKIIKNKELSTLRDVSQSSSSEIQHYSIVDLYKPRNRFLTKLLMSNLVFNTPMHRAIYYSKYAPDIAQFLYSLLNENKFADYKYDFEDNERQLLTHPIFSPYVIDCYFNSMTQRQNQNSKFIKHMLTTMFGLHIAHKAMLNDYAAVGLQPKSIPTSVDMWNSPNETFFISYLKHHCSLGSNLLNELFSKSDLIGVFMCNARAVETAGCKQEPFGIQSKYIFLS